jgi:CRP-like cAMP-binding protein
MLHRWQLPAKGTMANESNIWFFEDVDLYNILCPHKVPAMRDRHHFHTYSKDDFIYFEEQPSDTIYLVVEGRVKIGSYTAEGREITKAILSAGELFGELALMGEERHSDYAQAMDADTRICPMGIDDLKELMAQNKNLSLKIYKLIGMRIKKLERQVESLVFKDSRTRVVEFLRDWAIERGKKVGYETMMKNYLTHKDIASLTGTSRQTVTTILNELKEKNIINFDRRRILIRDMNTLR